MCFFGSMCNFNKRRRCDRYAVSLLWQDYLVSKFLRNLAIHRSMLSLSVLLTAQVPGVCGTKTQLLSGRGGDVFQPAENNKIVRFT